MMKLLVLQEYSCFPRSELNPTLLRRLYRFDASHSRLTGHSVFDWSRREYLRAINYVGVVQVPGLTVEILPKIDGSSASLKNTEIETAARQNLIYMLSLTKKIPIAERDMAGLTVKKLPLLEALMSSFAEKLIFELGRGLDSAYVHHQENTAVLKGKLLLNEQIRRNAAHREMFFVAFDEFVTDTWLNRILKAASTKLLFASRSDAVQKRLREALLMMTDVSDVAVGLYHFENVNLTRNNERFRPLLDFCRMFFQNEAPTPESGQWRTFSLLFPMDQLFEEFLANFICRYSNDLGILREEIHPQSRGCGKWLAREKADGEQSYRFRVKPDLLIGTIGQPPRLILDTKWKVLQSDDYVQGISQSDIYQLYAYAHRYDCSDNVLLYPAMPGLSNREYFLEETNGKRIRIELINMNRDLHRERNAFKQELKAILS